MATLPRQLMSSWFPLFPVAYIVLCHAWGALGRHVFVVDTYSPMLANIVSIATAYSPC